MFFIGMNTLFVNFDEVYAYLDMNERELDVELGIAKAVNL